MKTITVGNQEYELTDEKKRRIFSAIEETERLLNKELSYSEDLQKSEQIEFYRSHITKLLGYLA